MSIEQNKLKNIIEAALLAVGKPMTIEQLTQLFAEEERPSNSSIKVALTDLVQESSERGIELKEVASGYRYQAKQEYSEWLSRLWEERPAKYSRAALETLALIAYRQPVTRAEIEDVRGVGVSSSIVKTMLEREWIRVVGHRDVPGRPALYATTKQFLDYFNMKSLEELPTLAEIKDLEDINPELDLPNPDDERIPPVAVASDETEMASNQASESAESEDYQVNQTADTNGPVLSELDQQDLTSGIEPQGQTNLSEQEVIDPTAAEQSPSTTEERLETDDHLQKDVFDELDDVHTESLNDSFYAEPSDELDEDKSTDS